MVIHFWKLSAALVLVLFGANLALVNSESCDRNVCYAEPSDSRKCDWLSINSLETSSGMELRREEPDKDRDFSEREIYNRNKRSIDGRDLRSSDNQNEQLRASQRINDQNEQQVRSRSIEDRAERREMSERIDGRRVDVRSDPREPIHQREVSREERREAETENIRKDLRLHNKEQHEGNSDRIVHRHANNRDNNRASMQRLTMWEQRSIDIQPFDGRSDQNRRDSRQQLINREQIKEIVVRRSVENRVDRLDNRESNRKEPQEASAENREARREERRETLVVQRREENIERENIREINRQVRRDTAQRLQNDEGNRKEYRAARFDGRRKDVSADQHEERRQDERTGDRRQENRVEYTQRFINRQDQREVLERVDHRVETKRDMRRETQRNDNIREINREERRETLKEVIVERQIGRTDARNNFITSDTRYEDVRSHRDINIQRRETTRQLDNRDGFTNEEKLSLRFVQQEEPREIQSSKNVEQERFYSRHANEHEYLRTPGQNTMPLVEQQQNQDKISKNLRQIYEQRYNLKRGIVAVGQGALLAFVIMKTLHGSEQKICYDLSQKLYDSMRMFGF